MNKHTIQNVPRYFEQYVCDCFHNALTAYLMYRGINTKIVLADYLSFLYDSETGYMGVNYLFKYNTSVEFTEEELNTSFGFAYFPVPEAFDKEKADTEKVRLKDRIVVKMYLENDIEIANERLRELLNRDIPGVLAVDLHYMQYHRAYKKEHGLHYIVVTGYDEEEGCYELFDKYKLSSSDFDGKLPIEDIKQARSSDIPLNNAMMGDYKRPLQNVWCEVEIDDEFKIEEKRIISVLEESLSRMSGEKQVLGCQSGIRALDTLIGDLEKRKQEELGERNLYLFKTYYNETFKTIARSRKRFKVFIEELSNLLPSQEQEAVANLLEESAKHWDICANLSLKLGITKKLVLLEDIIKQLNEIKAKEINIVEIISNVLKNG